MEEHSVRETGIPARMFLEAAEEFLLEAGASAPVGWVEVGWEFALPAEEAAEEV